MTFLQPYPVVLKDWRYSKCILFEDDPKKSHFATSIWRAKRASHRQASQKSPKATYYECQNKCKWDILDDFQTTWESSFWHKNTNLSFFYSVTIAIIWSFTQTNGSVSFPTTPKLCLVHIAVFKRLILPRICLQFSCEEMKDPCVSRESIPPKIHHLLCSSKDEKSRFVPFWYHCSIRKS